MVYAIAQLFVIGGQKTLFIHSRKSVLAVEVSNISLLPLQVIALQIGWEFCIPLKKGKEAHAFHIV